jgi:Raf kinase inhibitor-like YbhB/YbcL family protein
MSAENAFAASDAHASMEAADNRNPHLAWEDIPNGTLSLALFCHDADAPLDHGSANLEGLMLPHTLRRSEFFHWVLLDIPPALMSIAEGQFSAGLTPGGKQAATVTLAMHGGHSCQLRQGLNDFTERFASDPAMAGDYYGYDGPFPPWNDERIHHYVFRLYALDVAALAIGPRFTGRQARAAMFGHIIDEAQLIGAYALQPELAGMLKK